MNSGGKEHLFPTLLLLARPGAGKSEVIRFLKNCDEHQRSTRFHIGKMHEIDDFPMLWAWFEEDALLSGMGHPRLHTDSEGYFREPYLWDLLIRRINLEWEKARRDSFTEENGWTSVVEFSRGVQHGGFARAFEHCSAEMLKSAAILYIQVSWEESLRKNRSRFNPDKPDSILEHGLPDEKLRFLYRDSDWGDIAGKSSGRISVKGVSVPYAVMENEDDVTTHGGSPLEQRITPVLETLWELYSAK